MSTIPTNPLLLRSNNATGNELLTPNSVATTPAILVVTDSAFDEKAQQVNKAMVAPVTLATAANHPELRLPTVALDAEVSQGLIETITNLKNEAGAVDQLIDNVLDKVSSNPDLSEPAKKSTTASVNLTNVSGDKSPPTPKTKSVFDGVPLVVDSTIAALVALMKLQLDLNISETKLATSTSVVGFEAAGAEAESQRREGWSPLGGALFGLAITGGITYGGTKSHFRAFNKEREVIIKEADFLKQKHLSKVELKQLRTQKEDAQKKLDNLDTTYAQKREAYEAQRAPEMANLNQRKQAILDRDQQNREVITDYENAMQKARAEAGITELEAHYRSDKAKIKAEIAQKRNAKLQKIEEEYKQKARGYNPEEDIFGAPSSASSLPSLRSNSTPFQTKLDGKKDAIKAAHLELDQKQAELLQDHKQTYREQRAKLENLAETTFNKIEESFKLKDLEKAKKASQQNKRELKALETEEYQYRSETNTELTKQKTKFKWEKSSLEQKIQDLDTEYGTKIQKEEANRIGIALNKVKVEKRKTVANAISQQASISANVATNAAMTGQRYENAQQTMMRATSNVSDRTADQKHQAAQTTRAITSQLLDLMKDRTRSQVDVMSTIAAHMKV